jgi:hypothetical protein
MVEKGTFAGKLCRMMGVAYDISNVNELRVECVSILVQEFIYVCDCWADVVCE